jgi:hypothetical protein
MRENALDNEAVRNAIYAYRHSCAAERQAAQAVPLARLLPHMFFYSHCRPGLLPTMRIKVSRRVLCAVITSTALCSIPLWALFKCYRGMRNVITSGSPSLTHRTNKPLKVVIRPTYSCVDRNKLLHLPSNAIELIIQLLSSQENPNHPRVST